MHARRRRLHRLTTIPHQHRASNDGCGRTGLTGTHIKLTSSLGHINCHHLYIMGVVQRHYLVYGTGPLDGLTADLAGGDDFGGIMAFERPVNQRLS